MARFGDDIKFPSSAALIHQCDSLAYHLGLSGEDRMTIIAHYSLQRIEALTKQLLDLVNMNPTARIEL
jgi:hypothetical protein